MKYYLAVVQNPETENETANLYAYNNENDAYALFHNELAVRGETRTGTMCKIFTDSGVTLAEEYYVPTGNIEQETYYVLIIQNQGEQGEADTVFKQTSYDSALAMFHHELGYREASRHSTIVSILSDNGNSIRDGKYFSA